MATIPSSNFTSAQVIEEASGGTIRAFSSNDADVRALAEKPSGMYSSADWAGRSSVPPFVFSDITFRFDKWYNKAAHGYGSYSQYCVSCSGNNDDMPLKTASQYYQYEYDPDYDDYVDDRRLILVFDGRNIPAGTSSEFSFKTYFRLPDGTHIFSSNGLPSGTTNNEYNIYEAPNANIERNVMAHLGRSMTMKPVTGARRRTGKTLQLGVTYQLESTLQADNTANKRISMVGGHYFCDQIGVISFWEINASVTGGSRVSFVGGRLLNASSITITHQGISCTMKWNQSRGYFTVNSNSDSEASNYNQLRLAIHNYIQANLVASDVPVSMVPISFRLNA
ncbi:MAG: hypothetical protein ACRDCT_26145 [Shewanella sp.]